MTISQKPNETGWFYHAPAKPSITSDSIGIPATSQIPGLSNLPDDLPVDFPPKSNWIREGDSKYIRLAKQGGRQDLLRFHSPPENKNTKEPISYPRVDWFYLEDNRIEDTKQHSDSSNYEFMLPEYMVHHTKSNKSTEQYKAPRLPYADNTKNVYTDTHRPNDKNIPIEEPRKTGTGVRNSRMARKIGKYNPLPDIERKNVSATKSNQEKFSTKQMQNMAEKPVMGKILSYGYAKDWQETNKHWSEKHKTDASKIINETSHNENNKSEYSANISDNSNKKLNNSKKKDQESIDRKPHSCGNRGEEEKDLFKLSRFKNVPAKTNSHRSNKEKE